jgi:hypothetical protein
MHLFANGGHAFVLRATDALITHWSGLVERRLESTGVAAK